MAGSNALDKLVDLEAIRDLARRYAHHIWQKDVPGAVALFAADGVMDMGDRPAIKGHQELTEVYEAAFTGQVFQPFVHNHVIEVGGDGATGTCYLDLRATMEGKSMIGAGYYHDEYVRVEGEWKFKSRKLTLSYFVPLSEGWVQE